MAANPAPKRKTSASPKKSSNSNQSTLSKALTSVEKSAKRLFSDDNNSRAAASNDTMLYKFFVNSLKDIYWAENHLVKALAKMEKSATSEELKAAFADHQKATQTHAVRLEKAFKILGETARGKKCEAMEGLLAEGKSIIEETEKGTATRDVGLIFAAQKVEHYEIASYGGLVQLAKTLGYSDVADILAMTLEEEKETDELLTDIAESGVNYEALDEEE